LVFEELRLETLLDVNPEGIVEDEVPEPAKKPVTRSGDLWILASHRLLCGDSTKPADVARLLDGAKPRLMVTDPPYGVDYDPHWRTEAAKRGLLTFAPRREGKVRNDDRVTLFFDLLPLDVGVIGGFKTRVQLNTRRTDRQDCSPRPKASTSIIFAD
jgi:hypothetical protein